ncbi:MAG: acyl carrier protein [Lachnospiraceae bacterium]|nr:acyl carrier protein [Lachnospiraceae bacterium]
MNITDEIKKFIREYAKKEVEEITENTKMIAELGIDSLTFVRMVNDAENNFDVTIPDDKLIAVRTVGDFVKLLQN